MSPQEISAATGLADNTGEASVSGGAQTGPLPTATVSAQTGSATISVQVMELNGDAVALRGAAEELTRQMLRRL